MGVSSMFKSGLSSIIACMLSTSMALAEVSTPLAVVDPGAHQQALENYRELTDQAIQLNLAMRAAPAGRAQASLQPMFSAQQGSWPFEPFVHNGLFRAIAGYQNQHPRAVVIRGGTISLAQLHAQLDNERVLSRHDNGYLLHFPLMIEPDAALLVENTQLHLYSNSGTALINRGQLILRQAGLHGYNDGQPHTTDRPYRPFVINWAGSQLQIEGAELSRLGYNEHLSRGISSARSTQQGSDISPARVMVTDSRFSDMSVGLELSQALARVETSAFEDMQQYALDLADSGFVLAHNRVAGVRNNSGIRISGRSDGLVEHNRVLKASKSAIEVSLLNGNIIVRSNQIGGNSGYGLLLRDLSASSRLVFENNLIGNTQLTAIDGGGLHQGMLVNNRIMGTPEYAISIRNEQRLSGPLQLTGNHLEQVGKAMIRIEGVNHLVLGENRYLANPLQQNLLIGDLLPFQAELLEATLKQGCLVAVDMAQRAAQDRPPLVCPGRS
ncbi:right-handed parallel beta-helix repeat-containing protein [Halopseudomonas salegens]|uniref:mannuronan 5-epimerase n=1 Tax=Halopseudomonas salegens TaxID=1434072 RepID=A0A1H2HT21_9GAMM|nr:right-handed parallel beta-helix repeat-containing protein [Halopseudomonas salegens]SDU35031.1 poly(beta-D-mannuronate) C5 epimerase [Halopseudomonas salegens]